MNTGIAGFVAFDPYPFGLLTMIVSLEAICLSIFILMAQNRASATSPSRMINYSGCCSHSIAMRSSASWPARSCGSSVHLVERRPSVVLNLEGRCYARVRSAIGCII